jgi:hypothetical protein
MSNLREPALFRRVTAFRCPVTHRAGRFHVDPTYEVRHVCDAGPNALRLTAPDREWEGLLRVPAQVSVS